MYAVIKQNFSYFNAIHAIKPNLIFHHLATGFHQTVAEFDRKFTNSQNNAVNKEKGKRRKGKHTHTHTDSEKSNRWERIYL